MPRLLPPIHPGEHLLEDFMKPLDLSRNALARELRVPPQRISEIVQCRRSISADTALRLAQFFGTTPQFWLNLQTATTSKSRSTPPDLNSASSAAAPPSRTRP